MKHYIDYMDNISADPALKDKIKARMAKKTSTRTHAPLKYALVACTALLLLGLWIVPEAISNWRTPDPRVTYWTDIQDNDADAPTGYDMQDGSQVNPGSGDVMPGGLPPEACVNTDAIISGGTPPMDSPPPWCGLEFNPGGDELAADRRWIDFTHELTDEQMRAVFPNLGPGFIATAMYFADGTLIEVDAFESHFIDIDSRRTHTRIQVAEGAINHTVLFMHEDEPIVSYVHGVAVTAAVSGSDEFAMLTADFMLDNIAYHVRVSGPVDIGEVRLNEIVYQLVTGGPADLSVLADPVIPELRDEWLTLDEARLDPDFGRFVPAYIPDRLNFGMANRWLNQHHNNLLVTWTCDAYREDIWLVISTKANYHQDRLVSAADSHKFDKSLFEPPYAYTVPDEFWQIHMNPIFFANELTFELVQMRSQWDGREDRRLGDTHAPGWRINFGVLYGDVVFDIHTRGLTPEEVWEMVQPLIDNM